MAFSSNLRYLRKKYNLSQDELAEKLGYKSFTTIQKWESGVSEPSISVVKQLSAMFNITMDELMNIDLENGEKPSVFIVNWLPAAVAGLSVKNPDEGYTILINACLNAEKQYQAYRHEMQHINDKDFDYIFDVNELEDMRHNVNMEVI